MWQILPCNPAHQHYRLPIGGLGQGQVASHYQRFTLVQRPLPDPLPGEYDADHHQYFALDLNHAKAQAMLAMGTCALYVPSTLADVRLELYAVLRA